MADVRKWKFPKGGLEAAEITVPLLFVPKGMELDTVVQWERKVGGQESETPTAGLGVGKQVSPVAPKVFIIVAPFRPHEHKPFLRASFPQTWSSRKTA
jgi:hypothetical protein